MEQKTNEVVLTVGQNSYCQKVVKWCYPLALVALLATIFVDGLGAPWISVGVVAFACLSLALAEVYLWRVMHEKNEGNMQMIKYMTLTALPIVMLAYALYLR